MNNISIKTTELFKVFLKIGSTGFGGPLALIALMEKEFIQKRRELSSQEFNEAFVFCKLLPGPLAYQMALWIGQRLGGLKGAYAAGFSFLLPAFLWVLLLSILYPTLGNISFFNPLLDGMRIGALALIFDSVYRMFLPYRKIAFAYIYGVAAIYLMFIVSTFEPLIVLVGGALHVLLKRKRFFSFAPFTLLQLFWVHFKAGAFVFGTGLAIIPFLEREVVEHYRWLSKSEFMDGIALGQITPGPVTMTSVFIGYNAHGLLGVMAAFIGMYLPGILIILYLLPKLKNKIFGQTLADFHEGAIPYVIGCLFGASIQLSMHTFHSVFSFALFLVLLICSVRSLVTSLFILPLGAILSCLWEYL